MSEVTKYAACAIAANTRRTYSAGGRRFVSFCSLCNLQPYPASDLTLSCFCAFLARSVRPCTISVYLQAVRNAHIEQGLEDPLIETWLLKRVLKGVQRCHGTETVKPRLPITMPTLRKLVDACDHLHVLPEHDRVLFKSAVLLAFFGFLRCSEFTEGLTRECIRFESGSMTILLKRSKTDQFGKGVHIVIGPAGRPYCPVYAMLRYLAMIGSRNASTPLYVLAKGVPLSRAVFTSTVRLLLEKAAVPNIELYSGHSFRIGAATTAAMAGIPDSLIRSAGRWQSDVCLRYMRIPMETKSKISAQLASVSDLI